MWFLIIFSFLNAALDNEGFLLKHRLNFAGLPLNTLDALTVLGSVLVVMRILMPGNRYAAPTHNLFVWTMFASLFGLAAGLIGNAVNGGSLYQSVLALRNYATFPLSILYGYMLYQTVRSGRPFLIGYLLAGISCALLILMFFTGTAADRGADVVVEQIRATAYIPIYAIIAGVFLAYSFISGNRVMPSLFAVPLAVLCLLGGIATLGRTEWLCTLAGLVFLPFLLPPGHRTKAVTSFLLLIPVLVAALWFSLHFASQVTGRDMHSTMVNRLYTLIPGLELDDGRPSSKAWDTRLPGIKRELELWLKSPLLGQGFAYQTTIREFTAAAGASHQHNAYTAALAGAGPAALLTFLLPIIGSVVIGRRMVRGNTDRHSIRIGALAAIAGFIQLVYGACTMSHNSQRGAIACGILCGVIMRARAMELALLREYESYLDPSATEYGATPLLTFAEDEPLSYESAID